MSFFSIAAPIIGSLISSKLEQDGADDRAEAANQFTEKQLKNRHQWEVADLRAAGLNPILSAHGTPSIGGSAKADTVPMGERAINAGKAALESQIAKAQIEQMRSQADLNRHSALSADAAARSHDASALNSAAQAASTTQWMKIKEPLADVSDVTSDVTSRFKNFSKKNSSFGNYKPSNPLRR